MTARGRGEAFLNYTVQPKAGLATGTPLNAQATVVFDTNAPLCHQHGAQHHRRRDADEQQ